VLLPGMVFFLSGAIGCGPSSMTGRRAHEARFRQLWQQVAPGSRQPVVVHTAIEQ
jgi:hypothetical protein